MKSWMSTAGSVGLAVVASACCWLPLLLLSVGVGTATVAGVTTSIEATRPVLALVALPLLALSWWLTFFRKKPAAVAADDCCAAPTPATRRASKANRVLLPIATVFVLAMLAFPHQVFGLFGTGGDATDTVSAELGAPAFVLTVPGMT